MRLRLREIFFGLGKRGGFGLALQFKQQLPGLDGIAARDREFGERAAERGGDIDIFALDVALETAGGILRAAGEQRGGEREPE